LVLIPGFNFPFEPGQVNFAAVVVAVLQAGEVAGNFVKALPAGIAVATFLKIVEVIRHFREDDASEVFEGVIAVFIVCEFFSLFRHLAKAFLTVSVAKPIFVTRVAPFGEVLFGDGFAPENVVEKRFGGGKFIEPLKEWRAELAIEQAEVEFFTGFVRKTGDFADSSFHEMNFLTTGEDGDRSAFTEFRRDKQDACPTSADADVFPFINLEF
jgi:hypothetical protein